MYKVQPVNGGNTRTLHRNLLLPLREKLEPDYKSDGSILDEDLDDDSVELVDFNTKGASQGKSQDEIVKVKPKPKKGKHVECESQLEFSPDMCFESDSVVSPDLKVEESEVAVSPDNMSTDNHSHPSLDSEASSLVNTNELLEFIDIMDMDEPESTKQSEVRADSEQTSTSEISENPIEQTYVDPKSESQFSSFMSYHEGESSSLDQGTTEQEVSKSPIEESTEKNDSGANNQVDVISHDEDIIAYETKESSSPSIEISSSTTPITGNEKVTEFDESEPAIEVEVMEPRRSSRSKKQTQLFGNPLLYRVTYHLTPWFVPNLLQHLSETMETLQNRYGGTVEF